MFAKKFPRRKIFIRSSRIAPSGDVRFIVPMSFPTSGACAAIAISFTFITYVGSKSETDAAERRSPPAWRPDGGFRRLGHARAVSGGGVGRAFENTHAR